MSVNSNASANMNNLNINIHITTSVQVCMSARADFAPALFIIGYYVH